MRPRWKSVKTGLGSLTIVIEDPDTSVTPSLYLCNAAQDLITWSRETLTPQFCLQLTSVDWDYNSEVEFEAHSYYQINGQLPKLFFYLFLITKTVPALHY